MNTSLLRILRCPATGEELDAHAFETVEGRGGSPDIQNGVLISRQTRRTYAIQDGVPVMFENTMPRAFMDQFASAVAEVTSGSTARQVGDIAPGWSFSSQWSTHKDLGVERTWGWTVESRIEQMFRETGMPREWFAGKLLLDAGCGNGMLTDGLTELGAETVGIDFSDSVFRAHAARRSPSVHYIRGDLQRPPFAPECFDVVISNGVLHHTPNTERTFNQVARCVKPDGVFYMWLYSLPEGFFRRNVYYGAIDTTRAALTRLPPVFGRMVARALAHVANAKYRSNGKPTRDVDELVIEILDTLTPRWRHYHTPMETARWYFNTGFGAPTVTNWDNKYGFGVVATKRSDGITPGEHFDQQWAQMRSQSAARTEPLRDRHTAA